MMKDRVWRRASDTLERPDPDGRLAASPCVCLIYESEAEGADLLGRLHQAGLGELPRVVCDLGPAKEPRWRLRSISRSLARPSEALGAAAVMVLGFVGSHWMLMIALTVSLGPLFLVSRWVVRSARPATAPAH